MLRRLSTGAMITILDYTLNHENPGKVFGENALLDALRPRLQQAYEALLSSRPAEEAPGPEQVRELSVALKGLDKRHDDLCRLLHSMLTLAARHAETEAYAAKIEGLQERLFPFGLKIVRMKYTEEAGEAQRLAEQIAAVPTQKLLQKLKFTSAEISSNALQVAQGLTEVGQEMSEKLNALYGLEDEDAPGLREAKNAFIVWMNRLQDLAGLELGTDSDAYRTLFKALDESLASLPEAAPETSETPNTPESPQG